MATLFSLNQEISTSKNYGADPDPPSSFPRGVFLSSFNKQTKPHGGEEKTSGSGIAKHIILERDYIRRLAMIVLKSSIKTPWLGVKLGIWEGLWLNLVNRQQWRVHEQNRTLPSNPAAWFSENFCILGEAGGKAISLLFRFQSFFLHAVMHFWILSRSVCFSPFLSSFPRVVWKVADFSTPHQLWTEHHSFHRAPPLFTDELSDSWGRNRVSAPQESLWESTPPWVIHLNSLNCRKSNILNLKSIPAWPSLTLCLYLLWKFSLISNTRYRFSLANSPFLFHF